ncbi:MAG: hypothetical protein WDO16_02100 [Bacteroidota bacterium]
MVRIYFNPAQDPDDSGDANKRYWRFLPFQDMRLESLTEILTDPEQIYAFNNHPFDPDAIARLRISAYAKTIVMRYIDNLIAWGDYLFEQDTRESITQATNLYVMASDLLGKRPVQVGELKPRKARSFNEIKKQYDHTEIATGTSAEATNNTITLDPRDTTEKDGYDGAYISVVGGLIGQQGKYITRYESTGKIATISTAWDPVPDAGAKYSIYLQSIPEFLVRLENTGSLLSAKFKELPAYSDAPFNDINSYFGIPENQELMAYWDKVEDRLFKIRHCMNIKGQVRTLALFAPPIDPRELIRAASGSGSLSAALQMNLSVPNYRFNVMIEKVKSLVSSLMSLGSSLLSALQNKDAEALSILRNTQEATLLNLNTFIKEQQVQELIQQKASLQESLNSANYRTTYYDDLIKKGLSASELTNIIAMTSAMAFNVAAGITKTISGIGYALPQAGSPFAMTYGGQQIGSALNAASGALEIGSMVSDFVAQLSITMAGYERRASDWQLQLALAEFDTAQ